MFIRCSCIWSVSNKEKTKWTLLVWTQVDEQQVCDCTFPSLTGDSRMCHARSYVWLTWQQDPVTSRCLPHGNPGKLGCQVRQPLMRSVWRSRGKRATHTLPKSMSVTSPAALLSHHSVPDSRTLFLLLGSILPRLNWYSQGPAGWQGPKLAGGSQAFKGCN